MSHSTHTYGPTCHLARIVSFSGSKGDDDIPYLKPQYFYYSTYSVDDPLSAAPIPTGNESRSTQEPPIPFSARDNNALEEAWRGIASEEDTKRHKKVDYGYGEGRQCAGNGDENKSGSDKTQGGLSSALPGGMTDGSAESKPSKPGKRREKGKESNLEEQKASSASRDPGSTLTPDEHANNKRGPLVDCCSEMESETGQKSKVLPERHPSCCSASGLEAQDAAITDGEREPPCCDDSVSGGVEETKSITLVNQDQSDSRGRSSSRKRKGNAGRRDVGESQGDAIHDTTIGQDVKMLENKAKSSTSKKRSQAQASSTGAKDPVKSMPASSAPIAANPQPVNDSGTTGFPFMKFPSRKGTPQANNTKTAYFEPGETQASGDEAREDRSPFSFRNDDPDPTETQPVYDHDCKSHKSTKEHPDVPVGVSRLHLVELPALQMKPIYWAHVHDTAPVIRGTWFYKDSMYPVEPAVANQLEMGYRELRPWSQTWNDELNSATEVGAAGEEKIVHRLWPQDEIVFKKSNKHLLSTDPQCAARCFNGEASAEGRADDDDFDEKKSSPKVIIKKYSSSQVIYKDAQNAFILKSNLQPSAYFGRKPLQKIRRGRTVGIHVVRGFNRRSWDKLHPARKVISSPRTGSSPNVPVSGDADSSTADACLACKSEDITPNVTDLCLVVHGIGQKLSERVESFNFTHACNSVRRSVNAELGTEAVKKVLRQDVGGIMVLPVNWRSSLFFEDGGPMKDGDENKDPADFSLKDITPDTIPAVRNLISDVMLDIPFYMSHHKQKMIQAVVREANRVYRLWCKNNPNFHANGRVHIIAHSLGSAMALEILSKQPTRISKIDHDSKKIHTKYFDFNTTNLFCAGSPCGFFLHLEQGKLYPRRGQSKPGAEPGDDEDKSLVGEAGTYGCLAVDNIYNVMHCNDPIAYRLNPTVDSAYASGLKEAQVPSATAGFFESIGNAMKSVTPGVSAPVNLGVGEIAKAPPTMNRLPSQLEMEVHDFTREELAEKKFYLLNDNCQIDWLLPSGGGPFEVAYLDMLGAHSSYWERKEFIRFLVTEVGREPGKRSTLPNMRATKIPHKV